MYKISLFKINIRRAILVVSMVMGTIVVTGNALGISYQTVVEKFGRNTTLTGRDEIWESVLRMGSNPWIGVGYESFWGGERIEVLEEKLGYGINEAHNGYLDTYLNLGYVGLLILGLLFLSSFRKIFKKMGSDFDFVVFSLSFFAIYLMYNITESAFEDLHPFWEIFIYITICCDFQRSMRGKSDRLMSTERHAGEM